MDTTSWLKQTDQPLFGNLEWDKPERRDQAGKLLIIGGHQHNLGAPAKAYEYTKAAGIGTTQIILPNKVKPLVGATLPGATFLPSTPSGELSRDGINELFAHAHWADMLLLPGDLGHNSQTTLLISDLLTQLTTPAVLAKDTIDNLKNAPAVLLDRHNTTLVLSFADLQTLAKRLKWPEAFTFDMGMVRCATQLKKLSTIHTANILVMYQNTYLVAVGSRLSTTKCAEEPDKTTPWRVHMASLAACYQTWYPGKPFEALTHAAFLLK